MKVIKKILVNFIIFVWLIMAIFTTVCLISFNKYRISEFGKYTLVIMDNKELEPSFKKGSLLIVERPSNNEFQIGNSVFYYKSGTNDYLINHGKVLGKEIVSDDEVTFDVASQSVSSEYIAGVSDTAKVIPYIGYVLSIMESQWGYMFFVILPTVFAFVYEIYAIVLELKKTNLDES